MAAFNGLKRAFNGLKRALDFTKGSEELPPAKVLCQRDLNCDSMASCSSSFPISSSISSTSQWKYDVFLSFRGEDTRNTAVDIVNNALQWRGIYTFKDDEKLEKGKTIKPELFKAIEESRFAVVILSKNYASSTWCLDELVKIIDCEKEKGLTILPIFYDVDPSDLRKLKGAFANAFNEHEKQFKEEVVGTWRAALNHVADISGYHIKNSPLSEAVKCIVRLVSRKSCPEFSEITEGLVGIHSRLAELESCLALWLKDDVRSVGLWAMGGMGKSTLAKVAYETISKEFDYCCFIKEVRKQDLFSLQEYFISQISHVKDSNIQNDLNGELKIKKMLRDKKVLLVLDDVDVDESNKLGKLVKSDWFGLGSRIIITTRDKHLLERFSVDEIFEVKALNYEEALRLFCSKAFKKEQCPDEYLEPFKRFLEYVNGLPLALEVLGSFLIGKSTDEWKSALKMLKEVPDPGIGRVLKISFDGLHDSVKDIFIDIACFFNHEEKDHVVRMLDCIGRHSSIGLSVLIDKSLLKISNNKLWMHDLLRDMGRDIVRQESPNEPGKRSRLWLYEEIDAVLINNTGTTKVQAMDIRGVEACWRGFTISKKQKRPRWHPNAFSKMSELKFLRVRNVFPERVPKRLPNSLRCLDWSHYSANSLPWFQPDELVQLHLQHSKIEFLWEGMKNLKFLNMAGSSNMIKVPNFCGVPKLEELVLEGCSKLCTLDPSVGKLKNLKLLNLKKCQELTSLPNKFDWKSLVTLNLTGCSKVKKIPEFVGNMTHLQELLLEGTAITELPSSVKRLIGLTSLDLTDCKKFELLPSTICSLKSLDKIMLLGCSKFDKLPKDLGNITSLTKLNFSGTAIKELPSSIEYLNGLKVLSLEDCKKFVRLPSTVCSLKSLTGMVLSRCPKFVNLPENLGNLERLEGLYLEGTAIEVLPSSVGHLAALANLNLKDCKNLVHLPSTICDLKRVSKFNIAGCSKITDLPENLGNMESLYMFSLDGSAIKELPSSTIHLKREMFTISFKGCQLSSSSLTSMPRGIYIDLSDCNLTAIPSGMGRNDSASTFLFLGGNDFVSLPDSSSLFFQLRRLYLDGCKSLRSLSNVRIPSTVEFLCVDNCTSLERLPEGREPPDYCFIPPQSSFDVQCFNCVKLAENFENISNMFRGHCGQQFEISCIIPGREIPKWFEKVNICDTDVNRYYINKKGQIQLPGCDEWRGIVLCVVFLPPERHHGYHLDHRYRYHYRDVLVHGYERPGPIIGVSSVNGTWPIEITSEYGEVKSHHLWLYSLSKNKFCLPKTPGCSIDKKGFHQVELGIYSSKGLEVEKIGFCVV